jgi:ABC-type multidrug transport system ATPase subunit
VSGFTIINNLDFSIEENELRVLLGPNGAGKTTLICA